MRERLWAGGDRPKKLATAWLFSRTGGWRHAEYQCGYCKQKRLYLKRNCQKFFPQLVQIDRKPCWAPRATVEKKQAAVPGYKLSECPVSYITPTSMWLLELVEGNAVAKTELGSSLFGPDTRRYPAWWMDAVAVISSARNAYDRAELEAMKKDASN